MRLFLKKTLDLSWKNKLKKLCPSGEENFSGEEEIRKDLIFMKLQLKFKELNISSSKTKGGELTERSGLYHFIKEK